MANVTTYRYPAEAPPSNTYRVQAGGKDVFVYRTACGDFAAFECGGAVEVVVTIEGGRGWRDVTVRPMRYGVKAEAREGRLVLPVSAPANLVVESPGLPNLFLFVSAPAADAPRAGAANVLYFEAGKVHEVDELRLMDGQTLYIEGGAVVRGCVRATGATGVRMAGRGVLEDSRRMAAGPGRRFVVLEGCEDGRIEDLIMADPAGWMVSLGVCRGMMIRGIRQLGFVSGSDGVDICGSQEVRIENCFLRNGDDCVVVKALDVRRPERRDAQLSWIGEVRNVEMVGCSLLSYRGGCATEIGHELRSDVIENIAFRDCDILGVHEYGAPFGIHNADHATVRNVLWERCRVEHHYDKLVDLRIVQTRWSKDSERGQVRDVRFRDIDVAVSPYNPGYTTSQIGGFDAGHTVEGVTFEDFRMNGVVATGPDALDLYTKYASGIRFIAR